MDPIVNVLADRYASQEMKNIWSSTGRVVLERELWIAVLRAQKELGLDVDDQIIESYENVKHQVDLESIKAREKITRHDVKARIEEFCELAGAEHIHKGMTSRDLTENVEQLQIFKALKVVRKKTLATLNRLAQLAEQHSEQIITARTHNVAAQPTTFGKRIAMFGQEILLALTSLDNLIQSYPVRGIKGAVGTYLDQLTLFDGDHDKIKALESKIATHLGIASTINAVGQVYPRSLDYQVVSVLYQISSGASSFSKTLRIMAGNETASEGFAKGQVGSSAMPHKMNSRSCERVNGFHIILNGYLNMLAGLSGDQWNEGDVSCSVVRRVALPDSFYALDGLFETFLTILNQMSTFPAIIKQENDHYFPFLSTTTILMEAVKKGAGRELAHEAIKEHAVSTVLDLRNGVITQNDLLQRLAADSRLGLSQTELEAVINRGAELVGGAMEQVERFKEDVNQWLIKYPEGRDYTPGDIL
ncbi:adenylosuccinate lyase [Spirochaeta cellobiosiphila]|uniref:adenylosuccinate lyase n=1 Tax=Spirochaeta cellobiosiphila TaxID=504483 RepID=UPI0004295AD7|nr:adenylosuccinate lyase [Spirochaeta cellobiosiphila]